MKLWGWAIVTYLLVYLPFHGALSLLELWIWTGNVEYLTDPIYHLSGWLIFIGLGTLIAALTGVPLVHFVAKGSWSMLGDRAFLVLMSLLTPVLLLGNAVLFELIVALPVGDPTRAFGLATMTPGALLGSGSLYGWVVAKRWLSERPDRVTSIRWTAHAASPYVLLFLIMGIYGQLLPTLAPRIAYRISGSAVRMNLEMDVFRDVEIGTSVTEIQRHLPGFFSDEVLEGAFYQIHKGAPETYGYRLRTEGGVITHLEVFTRN